MNRRLGAGLLVASLWLVVSAPALAATVTYPQLRALAARAAAGDAQALAELRTVTSVGGQPADVAAALSGAGPGGRGSPLNARLTTLARSGPVTSTISPPEAQRSAEALLENRRYGKPVLDPISRLIQSFARAVARLAANTPGGALVFWAIAGAAVLAVAAIGARRMLRRLDAEGQRTVGEEHAAGEDPASLERLAQAAEARGAFDEAVRLRFRAGLLSLGERSAIDYRPSLLTGEVARQLHDREFDSLVGDFDRIAYGGASADEDDARAAREGWPRVLEGAGR
jgi:hypothetical protein